MKSLVPLLAVASLLLAAAPCGAVAPEGAAKPPAARANVAIVAEANNAFAADLYGKLAAKEGNFFFSPNSIETALVMTMAGARGKTAEEMKKVLHLVMAQTVSPDIHGAFGAFLKDLNAEKGPDGKPRGYQLSVANALWGQKGFTFLPAFLDLVKTNYSAGLSEVNFTNDMEGARKTINAWVEKETRDKIKDLITPGVLGRDTRLVLTNAIYFKGQWAEPFEKDRTQDEPFHLATDKTVTVSMMNRQGHYEYAEAKTFTALRLPYAGNELAMIILLPKKVDGLADLEKSLSKATLDKLRQRMKKDEVEVTIPKFTMTCQFELNKTLGDMGMTDAFSEKAADFSGMMSKKDLFLADVAHKAFIRVDEEGTEATAATSASSEGGSTFEANHPFIFLIRHEKSGAILFMGRLADPKGP